VSPSARTKSQNAISANIMSIISSMSPSLLIWTVTFAEFTRSYLVARRRMTWSVEKAFVPVAVGTVLIAVVLRLTFGYGHVL
jgi:hypothetical protein